MTQQDLAKEYEPTEVEEKWSRFWEENNSFVANTNDQHSPCFSIVIPPPNVTGTLHMGHSLNITLQDILSRYKRQKGYNVLWLPGTDHAGIATENVVERHLAQEGISRHELGREKFIQRVWEWKQEYGDKILNQIKRLGASVDWSRVRFTMDEGLSNAVREVFVKLYEDGLIYRGNYMTNWCPRCRTALADLEVEHEETQGGLYHVRYPLADSNEYVVVATTRPETMLGDTAVAVHPEDQRFRDKIGREIDLPLTGRKIPVIADSHVEKEFGTGCLKVTPAHDPHDFEMGNRHCLDRVKVIGDTGYMTEDAGEKYSGLDRFECRNKLVKDLEDKGLLEKQEQYLHNVGSCYRCDTVVEPTVSKQWFVATRDLAKMAKEAVENRDTVIFPSNWNNLYFDWLDNIRDWCISRQIWWGHRIPAWTCEDCNRLLVARQDPDRCPDCGSNSIYQDTDVLDTWFSSALWPFSTLGWPEESKELSLFYPTSVLVTAFDILFFWVARMMMMGLYFRQEVPFRHVYIHALVRDENGRKMSKSTGNVIDPLLMIQKYGADAMRFTLTAFAAMGRDIKLSESRIEGYKHFINKIWNAARLILLSLEDDVPEYPPEAAKSFSHKYILHELEKVKAKVQDSLEGYHFNEAAQALYQFIWHTYCDWYLEMIKPEIYSEDPEERKIAQACLYKTFTEILILLHPFVPFVSQEIWSYFPGIKIKDLSLVQFPESRPECIDHDLAEKMEYFQEVVISVRNIRSELNINPGEKLQLKINADGENKAFLQENELVITQLARLQDMEIAPDISVPRASATAVIKGDELYVPLEGIVDFEAELARLDKQLGKVDKDFQGLQKKLSNHDFLQKAPADVVEKEKDKLKELEEKREKMISLKQKLEEFI